MNNGKSLIKNENSIISKPTVSIKKYFNKFDMNKKGNKAMKSIDEDFEILKQVNEGNIKIKDIDINTQNRLIKLCSNRLNGLDKKMNMLDDEIMRLKILNEDLNMIS